MPKKFERELEGIKTYLQSNENEDAKRPLIYPLFKKLFKEKFKIESSAFGADTYIEGELVVELKSHEKQWLEGFYQALHYSKKGLSFPTICVITKNYLAIWKLVDIPEFAKKLAAQADAQKAASKIGVINANKTKGYQANEINRQASFRIVLNDRDAFFSDEKSLDIDLREFLKILKNLDSNRIQINTHDFIHTIEDLKKFYDNPIDAIHCFYGIVGYWDVTSIVVDNDEEDYDVQIVSPKTGRASGQIKVKPKDKLEFKKYIESHYIFTNEGSGLTADYYFSRFDEVISQLNPEYAKQHGIFFTDINLSKFALWYVHENFEKKLSDKYIVFDPAGGSGNLVTSWKGHLKHKIVSELQPDLLKTIERRMLLVREDDDELLQAGFTIIPKTSENIGLNFLDRSAQEYLDELKKALKNNNNRKLDKPLAFLLNPPYKSTDEKVSNRNDTNAEYNIHEDIIKLTGKDAGKERYAAFLAQILLIAKNQFEEYKMKSLLMIFTPTSWLIPRTTFIPFREEFDKYFKYEKGFMITSNEFFKLKGKWPLAFTIWSYHPEKQGNKNNVILKDFTAFKKSDLAINWDMPLKEIKEKIDSIVAKPVFIEFNSRKKTFRDNLPKLTKKGRLVKQPRFNFYRNTTKEEKDADLISGFPFKDPRHNKLKVPYGYVNGEFIGFMDNLTPVRLRQEGCNRHSNYPDRVWFRLDLSFIDLNKSKCFNKPPDQKGYCAYDLDSARVTFSWYAISKALNGKYPTWANQFDLWVPNITKEKENYFYALCFAYAFSENRSIVSRFEKDNPVKGAPEIIIDNPFSPMNSESFWSLTLEKEIFKQHELAYELVDLVKKLYRTFALQFYTSEIIRNIGLQDEPYFKYFEYPDYLTVNSGIIQIKKYAELHSKEDLSEIISEISAKTKEVRDEIYKILIKDFKYFE